jgi:hypothetical protein
MDTSDHETTIKQELSQEFIGIPEDVEEYKCHSQMPATPASIRSSSFALPPFDVNGDPLSPITPARNQFTTATAEVAGLLPVPRRPSTIRLSSWTEQERIYELQLREVAYDMKVIPHAIS